MSMCACLRLTMPHICVKTLYPCFSSYRRHCVWLPLTMHKLSVIPTYIVYTCVSVRMHADRDAYIFHAISGYRLRCEHSLIWPIRGCRFIPMETCLGALICRWICMTLITSCFFFYLWLFPSLWVRMWVLLSKSELSCFLLFLECF